MTATPSPLDPAPAPPPPGAGVTERAGDGLDRKAANVLLETARGALHRGDLREARLAMAEALRTHPGLLYVYRQLGLMLSDLGLAEAAEHCYRGVLPGFIQDEWFPERYSVAAPPPGVDNADLPIRSGGSASVPWQGVERHVCHAPRTRAVRAPKGVLEPVDSMFEQTEMTSSYALADRVEGGTLWFDGFNRAVLDSAGNLVDRHTRGNASLVRAVERDWPAHRIEGRAFFVGNRGFNNYYHWMLDILPSLHLFEKAGFELGPNDRVVVFSGASRFQRSTLARFGFGEERIVQISRTSPRVIADELVVPYYENGMGTALGDWVPAFLKEKFLGDSSAQAAEMPSIYLARARNVRNGRAVENEAEMIEHLESRGFATVFPEDYDVVGQAQLFARAETVLAPHGAGLTNIAFCTPGTRIVELYGDFMAPCYWALSEVCGLDYYNHCCSTRPSSVSRHERSRRNLHELRQRGFSVDLGELDSLLDMAGQGRATG